MERGEYENKRTFDNILNYHYNFDILDNMII